LISGQSGKLLSNDGSAVFWRTLGGDILGPLEATTVAKLQGRAMSAATPVEGDYLRWNITEQQWEPGPTPGLTAGNGIQINGQTVAVEDAVVAFYQTGSGAPAASCQTGRDLYVDTASGALYYCSSANLWSALPKLESGALPADKGGTGQTSFAKGDILAASGSASLAKVTAGADGLVLTADAQSAAGVKWAPANPHAAITPAAITFEDHFLESAYPARYCKNPVNSGATTGIAMQADPDSTHWGVLRVQSQASPSAGHGASISWCDATNAARYLQDWRSSNSWDVQILLRPTHSATLGVYAGLIGSATASPSTVNASNLADGVYFRFDSGLATPDSGSWQIVKCVSSVCTAASTGTSFANTWVLLRLRNDGGTIKWSVNNGAETALDTAGMPASSLPLYPLVLSLTRDTTQRGVDLDYWGFLRNRTVP
jgi:hypothetical protein